MDDHDGTGIPGKDSGTAAQAQPAGRRSPGPKPPAAKGRQTPAAAAGPSGQVRKAASGKGVKAVPAKPAAQAPTASAVKGTKAVPARPAKQVRKSASAKGENAGPAGPTPQAQQTASAKGVKAVAPAGVDESQGGDPRVAPAGQPTVPEEGKPWQVPGYLHERDLGAGACGRVVRAHHEASGSPVAITYLSAALLEDAAFRAEFRSEAELLAGLDSPYAARFHAYVEDGPHAATVTELVDGVGLDALLRENRTTDPEPALAVLKGSLLGLAAAHEAGILHRAYQPADVLVTTEGAVKLVDFGVTARSVESGTSGTPAGPTPYLAPERRAGSPASVASDVYAAAATCYASLTGTTPYVGSTVAEPAAPDTEEPVLDGLLPEPVRLLITRAVAAEPGQRPQSAADFAAELEAVATAEYGADWEDRGHRTLAALVGPLLPPSAGGEADTDPQAPAAHEPGVMDAAAAAAAAAASASASSAGAAAAPAAAAGVPGFPAGEEPAAGAGSPERRSGRRTKVLVAVAAAGAIIASTLAITAAVSGDDKGTTATVLASPAVATAQTPTPPPVTTSPSAGVTTASPTAAPASPTTAPPAADLPGSPAGRATATPAAPPVTPARPAKTTGPAAGPHVSSVAITGFSCVPGNRRTAIATVDVQYDGTAAGTLRLTWWRSATRSPQGAITMPAQTARFPKGALSYTFMDRFTFTPDRGHPYVGLTVSTDPASDSGNGSYQVGCH